MKASNLIDARVLDSNGEKIGHIFEIHATKSGPAASESWGRSLVVDEVYIGPRAAIVRLGYGRRAMNGPFILNWLGRHTSGYRARFEQIASVDESGHVVRLNCSRSGLMKL